MSTQRRDLPAGTTLADLDAHAGDGHAHADRFDVGPRCELCDPACANAAVFTLVAVGGPAWLLCPFHLGDKLRDELTAAQWAQLLDGAGRKEDATIAALKAQARVLGGLPPQEARDE